MITISIENDWLSYSTFGITIISLGVIAWQYFIIRKNKKYKNQLK
jgi:hypothetical protein